MISKEPDRKLKGAALLKHSVEVVFESQQSDAEFQAIMQESFFASCFDKGQGRLTQREPLIAMTQKYFQDEFGEQASKRISLQLGNCLDIPEGRSLLNRPRSDTAAPNKESEEKPSFGAQRNREKSAVAVSSRAE